MYEDINNIIADLEKQGYGIKDPWDVVDAFEKKIASYAGSKYAVSVDNCTNALFLCLKYLDACGTITIPSKTYLSVPGSIMHAGCQVKFDNEEWSGVYQLKPYPVYDGATRFRRGMYIKDSYQCLSFHLKKILPIGKGGMILTNDKKAVEWLKEARYEGRDNSYPYDSMPEPKMLGWNMYMSPEQAARGIRLFDRLPEENDDCGGSWKYKDISKFKIYK